MESRSRASPEQFAALIEFMESHGDLMRPQPGAQGRIKADRLWQQLEVLLNSIGGGVIKSTEKWKKVWTDWKTKTKKKALAMRREACATGGGPSSRQTLTALEERVLGIMGLTAVVGQVEIDERGFDDIPPQRDPLPSSSNILDTGEIVNLNIEGNSVLPSLPQNEDTRLGSNEVQNSPPVTVALPTPLPLTTSPIASTSRAAPRRRRPTTPSPVASPTASTPRRQRLLRARARRVQTPFERATSQFVAVENRRMQLEEDRESNAHRSEMERLRLESRRIEMEEKNHQVLTRILETLNEILTQLRRPSPHGAPV